MAKMAQGAASKKGVLGAFLVGFVGSLIAASCDFGIIIAIIGLAGQTGFGVAGAVVAMVCYALGRGVMIVTTGMSVGLSKQMSGSSKMAIVSKVIKVVMGAAIFALGIYMIQIGLY